MYNLSIKSFVLSGALCLCLWGAFLPANVNGIHNSASVPIQLFSEMVQLLQADDGSFLCAGFMITDRYVVTAAHCVADYKNSKDLKVLAKSTFTMGNGIERNVEAFYVPHKYNPDRNDWNVAVMKLVEPIPRVGVASMTDKDSIGGEIMRIAGWGVTKEGGDLPPQLRTSALTAISREECAHAIPKSENENGFEKYDFELTRTMSCARDEKEYVTTCSGDYGGPVYINRKVHGILSWSLGCGNSHSKGLTVYTNIIQVRPFINAVLCHKASENDVKNLKTIIPDLWCGGTVAERSNIGGIARQQN